MYYVCIMYSILNINTQTFMNNQIQILISHNIKLLKTAINEKYLNCYCTKFQNKTLKPYKISQNLYLFRLLSITSDKDLLSNQIYIRL